MIAEKTAPCRPPESATHLLTFFALAFAGSWSCWLLARAWRVEFPLVSNTLSLTGGLGPSLAAVVLVAFGGGRVGLRRWMTGCLQWRAGWRWVVLAFLLPAVFMGAATAVHAALGGTLPSSPAVGHLGMAAANFLLIFFVGGPLGEEFGWRGYALPTLQAKWGWRVASLLLGVICAAWHLPLFYNASTLQSHLPMDLYMLSALAASVLFAWLFNRSRGSIVPVLALHTAVNAWFLIIPVMVLPDGSNLRPFQIVVGMLVMTAIALLLSSGRLAGKGVEPA